MSAQVSRGRAARPAAVRKGRKGPDGRDVEVGQRVRALRLERGLSQTQLATQLGLTFQQVQKYEKGTNRIGAGRLQAIAEIFEVPVSEMFAASPSTSKREEGLFELADSAAALRLLRAYKHLPNTKMKQALVHLAVQLAGDE